jgi:hypothetical protein
VGPPASLGLDGADVSLADIELNISRGSETMKMTESSDVLTDRTSHKSCDYVDDSMCSEIVVDDSFIVDPLSGISRTVGDDSLAVNMTLNNSISSMMGRTGASTDFRISYIGFPEKNDEWIGYYSGRVRALNSMSGGKRGELPIREEVLYVATNLYVQDNLNLKSGDSGSSDDSAVAVNRAGPLFSPFYVEVVNGFGLSSGFQEALQYLQGHNQQDIILTGTPESVQHQASYSQLSTPTNSQLSTPTNPSQSAGLSGTRSPFSLTSIVFSLDIAAALGKTKVVLSTAFMNGFAQSFVKTVATLLRNINAAEFRNITIEKIEGALLAVEGFSLFFYGRNANAAEFEFLWLDIALFILDCPYLNKRLGGLKLVSDLIRRCVNALECPSGLRTTISTTNTEANSASNGSAAEVSVSYRVVPVVYSITLKQICERILETNVLMRFFRGEQAHYSLVARATDVFRTLAREHLFPLELITAAWEAGHILKMNQAFQLLADTFAVIDPKLLSAFVNSYITVVEPAQVSVEIVDIVSAIGLRCRSILMDSDEDGEYICALDPECRCQRFPHIHLALQLHASTTEILWNWAGDSSGLSNSVALSCLNRLENLVATGSPITTCVLKSNFPWKMQFERTQSVVKSAFNALAGGNSVSGAVTLIQACINSWPTKDDFKLNPQVLVANEPQKRILTKSEYATYLENAFSVIQLMTNAVIANRMKLVNQMALIVPGYCVIPLDKAKNGFPASATTICTYDDNRLFSSEQAKVNNAIIASSRCAYKEVLDCVLNFLHMFVRCSDALWLPRSCVAEIWDQIVMNAITDQEINAVMNFISRVVIRNLSPKSHTVKFTSDIVAGTDESGGAEAVKSAGLSPRRISVCSMETVHWIFCNLLCGSPAFLKSSFFSPTALDCIEKYFRWLNSSSDNSYVPDALIVERNDNIIPFVIVGKPSQLLGLDIFSKIVLSCSNDTVAAQAVKFLTALPRRLSASLVEAGELVQLRAMLLDQCLAPLQNLRAVGDDISEGGFNSKSGGVHVVHSKLESERVLKRLLMLLDGLLEESSQDCCIPSTGGMNAGYFDKLRPHGVSGHGDTLTLFIQYSGKMKPYSGNMLVQSTDGVGSLWDRIAARASREASMLKLFRMGKEIDIDDRNKTLAHLKVGKNETILVGEKMGSGATSVKSVTASFSTTGIDSETVEGQLGAQHSQTVAAATTKLATAEQRSASVPFVSLPSVVLSHSRQHFHLFFELLDSCTGSVCDDVWELISNRLPTAPFVLKNWLTLECDSIEQLLLPEAATYPVQSTQLKSTPAHLTTRSLSFLLYSLQVVDILMQSAKDSETMEKQMAEKSGLWARIENIPNHEALLRSWPRRFFAEGGIHAFMQAFAWVAELLEYQCSCQVLADQQHSQTQSSVLMVQQQMTGVTPTLLLQATELLTTMLKAVCIRAAHNTFPGTVLHAMQLTVDAPKSTSSALNEKKRQRRRAKIVEAHPLKPATAIRKERALLLSEWGWRINTEDDLISSVFMPHFQQELDLAALQRFVVLMLTLLRPFSRCKLFSLDGVVLSPDRLRVSATRARLRPVLQRLFGMWMCSLHLQPNVIADLRSGPESHNHNDEESKFKYFSSQLFSADYSIIFVDVLLSQLLLGLPLPVRHVQRVTVTLSEMESQLAETAEDGILRMISNADKANTRLTEPLDCTETGETGSCGKYLKRLLFQSILALRPPLLVNKQASDGAAFSLSQTTSRLSACYNPLFSLANKMFSLAQSLDTNIISVDDVAAPSVEDGRTLKMDSISMDSEDDEGSGHRIAADSQSDGVELENMFVDTENTTSDLENILGGKPTQEVGAKFLGDEYRTRISVEIFGELLSSHKALCAVAIDPNLARSDIALVHIGGTLSLLSSLLLGCIPALETLYADNAIMFLLQHCLGLIETTTDGALCDISGSPTVGSGNGEGHSLLSKHLPVLCCDDETRYSTQSCVSHIFS